MKNIIYIIIILITTQVVHGQLDSQVSELEIPISGIPTMCPTFFPRSKDPEGKLFIIYGWVKEKHTSQQVSYSNSAIKVMFYDASNVVIPPSVPDQDTFYPKGEIIEGWQRIAGVFRVPREYTKIEIELKAGLTDNSIDSYFDDIRVVPFNGNIKSFVYDEQNQRLMAELDENNFATFYEYGLEGELLRVKKETERGIYTIQETRSGHAKQVLE